MFTFGLLGQLEIRRNGHLIALRAPKHRVIVAALLVEANHLVPTERLAARLWGTDQPGGARTAVRTYVHRIRQLLGTSGVIITRGDSYLIEVADDALDLLRFRGLVQQARAAPDAQTRSTLLREALELWRGEPLVDVPSESLHREFVPPLREELLTAMELRFDADLSRGRHAELLDELRATTARHPLHEPFWSQLVRALHRSGRQAEAADAYRTIRTRLADELGVDPGAQLRDAFDDLRAGHPVPRQLPAPTPNFVGREAELAVLDSGAPICVIDGTAGVGKTTLAVQWAHRATDRFPDGQLYVNLRGFAPAGEPASPGDVLRGFLSALGTSPDHVPTALDQKIAVYRNLMAGRRALVVLDNARDTSQVTPLLPEAPGCQVVITTRNRLTDLDARPVTLDLLAEQEAITLLTRYLGPDRVAAERDAVSDLTAGCAHLPLALSIVGAQAALTPHFPLRVLADNLLTDLDVDVHTVFSWSYARLSPEAARVFRLCGLHPGPDTTINAAASLAGVPHTDARAALAELTSAHLLAEPQPGRFTCHDLLRAYAAEQVDPDERHSATHRMLDHYLVTAYAANRLLNPVRDKLPLPPPATGITVDELADHDQAWQWFEREEQVLAGVIALAASTGFDIHTWQLPWVVATYLGRLARWQTFAEQQLVGLAAAHRLDDRDAQARLHHMIGHARAELYEFDDAATHLHAARRLAAEIDDLPGGARAHRGLGLIAYNQRDFVAALAHCRSALALYEAAGHRPGQAGTLNALGTTLGQLGQYEEALTICEKALPLLQELGDRPGEANAWDSIGTIHYQLGEHAAAIVAYRKAISLFADVGERFEHAGSLGRLGDTLLAVNDRAAAHSAYAEAAAVFAALGHPDADEMRRKALAVT